MGCYPKPLTTVEADALIAPVLSSILADASLIGLPHMGRAFASDNREIAQRRAFASGIPVSGNEVKTAFRMPCHYGRL